ncbi:gamma-glutamyltransferase [Sneathiella glossodoripedis]|uniref:gamma-glutamyltransferase n=1 Tax=Sneathiella glossodoripedis TaxID=418853 RepID=UPI000AB9A38A|nr:gamma-glutamyltransferase [Sneathiella glossodoripedis]
MKNTFLSNLIAVLLLLCASAIATRPAHSSNLDGQFMISAANPLAAQAGYDILNNGGSAVDAAIAVQMVLTLVEPQSSGIGGGAFLVHYDAATKTIATYDGRERAPSAVTEDYFLKSDGSKYKFYEAVVGGKSVGVPGVVAMLELAHQTHGKLPWKNLFDSAIALSEAGFKISPRLHYLLDRDKFLKTKETAGNYFYNDDGTAKATGTTLVNLELAKTLRIIANEGAKGFYSGEVAKSIVQTVNNDTKNAGLLTLQDLASYQAVKRAPVCSNYRSYKVCGMGPPTSGGITVLQILKILEAYELENLKPSSAQSINLISEASALAFADRGMYLADEDFVDVPKDTLLSTDYLARRSRLIKPNATNIPYEAGTPLKRADLLHEDNSIELPSTSHFSIVDKFGNAVSMTTSVENVFGSRLMTRGFILNNQLTDFSFSPSQDGRKVNNRIEPGKRPRSSMSPMIILNPDDNLRLVIGSPGGSRIIGYVAKAAIAVLDWRMNVQDAINLPHHINRNGTLDLEAGTPLEPLKSVFEEMATP